MTEVGNVIWCDIFALERKCFFYAEQTNAALCNLFPVRVFFFFRIIIFISQFTKSHFRSEMDEETREKARRIFSTFRAKRCEERGATCAGSAGGANRVEGVSAFEPRDGSRVAKSMTTLDTKVNKLTKNKQILFSVCENYLYLYFVNAVGDAAFLYVNGLKVARLFPERAVRCRKFGSGDT